MFVYKKDFKIHKNVNNDYYLCVDEQWLFELSFSIFSFFFFFMNTNCFLNQGEKISLSIPIKEGREGERKEGKARQDREGKRS